MAKALESSNTPPVEIKKSNTMLYVGIGVVVLILGIGGFIAYKKFKKK
jgi:LPXTG-motif cell wall-anchored protein